MMLRVWELGATRNDIYMMRIYVHVYVSEFGACNVG
jgi:hypothetical protein